VGGTFTELTAVDETTGRGRRGSAIRIDAEARRRLGGTEGAVVELVSRALGQACERQT